MAESQAGHETTEEDATELQFPKGVGVPGTGLGECRQCRATLQEPHVECAACPGCPALCLPCFSRGAEFPGHLSDHPYAVIDRCCPVGEGWGGREELALLAAIGECGLGNWGTVSARVAGRSAVECRDHYLRCYVDRPPPELAGLVNRWDPAGSGPAGWGSDPVEYIGGTEHPPRPLPGTPAAADLAGYSAARGDFEVESNPGAEACVAGLDTGLFDGAEEECPGMALVAALLDGYRRRLAERHEAKRMVRDMGLLGMGRAGAALARLRPTLPRPLWEALPRLSALLPPLELDLLVAGLQAEEELRRHIVQLVEYRQAGLTRQAGVATYEALQRRRQASRRERQSLVVAGARDGAASDGWTVLAPGSTPTVLVGPGNQRRTRPPLNIVGMPGYGTLTEAEAAAASELRLTPEAFLHHKRLLVAECSRSGSLRLAQARTLLKIDVNKTRRLFDLLRDAGDIQAVVVQPHRSCGTTKKTVLTPP